MTVGSETYRMEYAGNDVTTAFPISFYFLENSHVEAVLYDTVNDESTTLSLTTHYTLAGAGVPAGGTLTMLTPPTSDEILTIIRNVPLTQATDYVENTAFPAESHEQALDKLTMIVQQLQEQLDRTVIQAASQTGNLTLPTPNEGYYLRWVSGVLQNVLTVVSGTYNISSFGESLVDDSTASEALSTLGVTAFAKTLLDDADAAAVLATLGFSNWLILHFIELSDAGGVLDLLEVTAFMQTLLDDADAATALTTLGVTAFAQTLLDDADAAAAQTTLGLSAFVKTLVDAADATAFQTLVMAEGQLPFPATQNASAGVNTLDDYEEGTWTPSVGGDATYNWQTGTYTKIGDTVVLRGRIGVNVLGTGSTTLVSGVPFAPLGANNASGGVVDWNATAVNSISMIANVNATSQVYFSGNAVSANDLTNSLAIFGNGANVTFDITYKTAT